MSVLFILGIFATFKANSQNIELNFEVTSSTWYKWQDDTSRHF
ncbi:hypothetical protein MADA3029_670033 [Vibrio nigripulchritudo MADA3029]|nr:hypothetical protein VIBNIMADA3020_610033 [Vibrio nigripulchritudo MADA3020]CCN54061.1 hypothetical protein VIBNIMADA3021_500033 [Vibrio nigripulchritudo MADA3021]CCN60923.1 hypothetical protein MADA3029_670033 [Vibrio nigripulchritudo MADA3029]